MKRISVKPRPNWANKLNSIGFDYHSIDDAGNDCSNTSDKFFYWREDVAYQFTEQEIERLYDATVEVHKMSLDLVDELIESGNVDKLNIPNHAIEKIEQSWNRNDLHLYGRFDFSLATDGNFKVLEYNADTPTSLLESSLAQWYWKEEVFPGHDQFNSIHEALVERAKQIFVPNSRISLIGFEESMEDWGNLQYLSEVFNAAGCSSSLCDVLGVGIDNYGRFVDDNDFVTDIIFKLYPWEHFMDAPYFVNINSAKFVEPIWKSVISNKAFMALLWEKHKRHPNLLKTTFLSSDFIGTPFVKKPYLSREGANVSFYDKNRNITLQTSGEYGEGKYVCQELCPLPYFNAPETTGHHGPQEKMFAVLGSWVVGDDAVGLDIREDLSPITKDTSYFVPHFF